MKRTVPKFQTEDEEARWWDEHLDEVEQEILQTMNGGSAQILTHERPMERMQSKELGQVLIQLPEADMKRARDLAEERGLDYRTYLRALLHEALDRESSDISQQ